GGPDTAIFLSNFSDPNVANGGPSLQPTGGNPGGFLQVTNNVNGQSNYGAFAQTDAASAAATFTFQFRIDNLGANGADGISFILLPTATFGTTGSIANPNIAPEDPLVAGALGFGFDTWGNAAPVDYVNPGELGPNYSEISLFYNGALISRIDDTRTLTPSLNIKDGAWHTVTGDINFQSTLVSMNVDGNPMFSGEPVAGLAPYDSRVVFGGRTGGANERASIDNLNVQFVPEPGIIGAVAFGGLLLGRRRR
ncbi:MAG: PEP-CTERM sorting domain-containing protein, partial [Opitutaceae bacterium]